MDQHAARIYAQALLKAAREAGTLDATRSDLEAFTGAMKETPELAVALFNPKIDTATKKQVVGELTAGGDRIFVNFIKLLIDKRRTLILFDLAQWFGKLVEKESGVVEVEVTSAIELPEETRSTIRRRIEKATGGKVKMKETVHEGIVGGLVLRLGDVIVDGSLRSRLRQLKDRLREAAPAAGREGY